jgi:rod shape-determining protein MreC
VSNPISYGLYKTNQSVGNQLYFVFAARFAAKESKAQKEQIAQLLSENAQLRTKLAESEAQLSQQQSLDPKTFTLIAARPIGLDRFLRIDKGFKDGIKQGQTVVYKDNFIGQVIDVAEKSANVKLLSDPDSKLSAFSLDKDGKAKGILLGNFGSEMLLDKVLHEEVINVGDLVYSEGTEGAIPRGLVMGRVTDVLKRENQVFKQAKVAPVFDIADLELVFLVQD